MKKTLAFYSQSRLIAILLLGFVSGLPLALTASTLSAWLANAGVNKTSIGLFAAVATPYALKFVWSPLIDGASFPLLSRLLGQRRGWMLATQLGLVITILLLGLADPAIDPWMTACFALLVAICSASQDIVIDAYRIEILEKEEYGAGAAMVQGGYRIGMLVSGAGALALSDHVSWFATYAVMASLMAIGIVTVLLSKEPAASATAAPASAGHWLRDHVVAPFADFMTNRHWLMLLLFIMLYKLGDAFLGIMTNPFLLEIGFTKTDIATVVKLYGFVATLLGLFLGGVMNDRFSTIKTLMICGIGHALTNLMFLLQARVGADIHVLALGIFMENLSGGMTAAAFVAFISSLTHVRYTATQYALLSSLAAAGRTWLTTSAGYVAEQFGWEMFFIISVLLAVPGLAVLAFLHYRMRLNPTSLPAAGT